MDLSASSLYHVAEILYAFQVSADNRPNDCLVSCVIQISQAGSEQFWVLSSFHTLMGQCYKNLSVSTTKMVSNECVIIAKQFVVTFMTSLVIVATV